MHLNNFYIKGTAMLKHMLYGVVVISTGYIVGGEEQKTSQNLPNKENVRSSFQETLPGRTGKGKSFPCCPPALKPISASDPNIPDEVKKYLSAMPDEVKKYLVRYGLVYSEKPNHE
jgi:hypothetical protein